MGTDNLIYGIFCILIGGIFQFPAVIAVIVRQSNAMSGRETNITKLTIATYRLLGLVPLGAGILLLAGAIGLLNFNH